MDTKVTAPEDVRLATEVAREIGLDPQLSPTDVRVHVIENRVILTGIVATVARRQAAERAAARVASRLGVPARIENDLTVEWPHEETDLELRQRLDAVLATVPGLSPNAVGARVEDGLAILVGHVTSAGQVEAALEAARRVPGLKNVVSHIDIVTDAPPDTVDLVNRVTDALGLDTCVRGREIAVRADPDGTVTLTGDVPTAEEREAAERVAAAVSGVHRVVNRIRLRPA